jgi:hypothetical protein
MIKKRYVGPFTGFNDTGPGTSPRKNVVANQNEKVLDCLIKSGDLQNL